MGRVTLLLGSKKHCQLPVKSDASRHKEYKDLEFVRMTIIALRRSLMVSM